MLKKASAEEVTPRCIYLAALQAIVDERYDDWLSKFGSLGLRVEKLTGEQQADL